MAWDSPCALLPWRISPLSLAAQLPRSARPYLALKPLTLPESPSTGRSAKAKKAKKGDPHIVSTNRLMLISLREYIHVDMANKLTKVNASVQDLQQRVSHL